MYPSYREIADLPLAERVAEMRKPEVRERILADKPAQRRAPADVRRPGVGLDVSRSAIRRTTSPPRSDSIGAARTARGVSPLEEAYDRLLDDDGHAMLLVTLANFRDGSLDTVAELIRRDDVVLGLGDGGAHYGMICDASFPTYMLTHWARDRASGRLSVAEAVRELTSVPARVAGLADRGRIAVGYKADLNVIDHAALRLHKPVIAHDLPAGGRRLDQTADGYVATIVSGEVIAENGVPTDARPGKLIRGRQPAPVGVTPGRAARSAVERRGRREHQQLGSPRPHLRAAAAGALPATASGAGRPAAQAGRIALRRHRCCRRGCAPSRSCASARWCGCDYEWGGQAAFWGPIAGRQRRRVRRAGRPVAPTIRGGARPSAR